MPNCVETQSAKARESLIPQKSKAACTIAGKALSRIEEQKIWRTVSTKIFCWHNLKIWCYSASCFFRNTNLFVLQLQKYSPNISWPKLSMLRSMLSWKENIDVFSLCGNIRQKTKIKELSTWEKIKTIFEKYSSVEQIFAAVLMKVVLIMEIL